MSDHRETLLQAVDLFAGPGGWDHGIEPLGIQPLGIEWDEAACATREARGLRTLQADVAELNPLDFGPCELLIASPPCQAFSVAGKRDGEKDIPLILTAARALSDGEDVRAELRERCADRRSLLVVEPLRWALALRPTWLALEQVPPVMELWRVFGDLLARHGYDSWGGILAAERYGVPQTRERAFLLASLNGTPHPPAPTHQAYEFGVPAAEQHTIKGTLLPWISMAQALGWDEDIEVKADRGAGMVERHGDRPTRRGNEPAFTVTGGGRSQGPRWTVRTGQQSRKTRQGDPEPFERDADAPAPTVTGNTDRWTTERPAPTIVTTRRSKDGLIVGRQLPEGQGENVGGWGWERPSTTVAGDSRVFQPGGHHEPGKQSQNAVRVTLPEASILQGFPPDYPWQGIKGKQFEQVGNAVPPPLAQAVIRALLGSELAERAARSERAAA